MNVGIFRNFISMGPHCCMRMRIDELLNSAGMSYGETGMFDYNICDVETLKKMISDCDVSLYFNEDNIEFKKTSKSHQFGHINLKNIHFKSIHDVPNCEGSELSREIGEYVAKYKRRHKRLLDTFRSRRDVALIYMEYISEDDAASIRKNIGHITRKNIPIVCLHDFGKNNPIIEESNGNFRVNYANLYLDGADRTKKTNWIRMDFLNWKPIFEALEEVYNHSFANRTRRFFL